MSEAFPPPAGTVVTPARNRRGLIALVLGIVAVVLAVVPFASYIAWLVGIAAIVLGILAVIRAGLPKRAGITGIVLGAVEVVLSLVLSIVYTVFFIVASTAGSAPRAVGGPTVGSGTSHQVVYSVTGGGRATAIAYYSVSGGQSGQSTLQDQPLPWSKTVTVRGTLTTQSSVLTVVGQHSGSGAIACSITLDGKVVSSQSGEGSNATAQCIYRPGS